MYIVESEAVQSIQDKYLVLELDTVTDPESGKKETFYCVIDSIPFAELPMLQHSIDAHQQLINQYKLQNWKYCASACHGLKGKFNGCMDSFYQHLEDRIYLILDKN